MATDGSGRRNATACGSSEYERHSDGVLNLLALPALPGYIELIEREGATQFLEQRLPPPYLVRWPRDGEVRARLVDCGREFNTRLKSLIPAGEGCAVLQTCHQCIAHFERFEGV